MKKIRIGDKLVGNGQPCFIIAEAGVNHNGSAKLAKKLIDLAKDSGADVVKFQTFRTENIVTKSADKAAYQKETTGKGESQFEMLKKLELTDKDFRELSEYARRKGIMFMSSPFDKESVDLVNHLGVPAFKTGSGEITNLPLLKYVAEKGKPMIVSTGMSTLDEVKDAVNAIKDSGNDQIILLHCTSNYPAKIEDCNLRAMQTLREECGVPVGYSDHTIGIIIPIVAAAMGACVVEKHFTADKTLPGPDHRASLDPDELREVVKQIRVVEKALGSGEKKPAESEMDVRKVARKSIVAKAAIRKGTIIREEMLAIKRPGTGLPPKKMTDLINRKAKTDIGKDDLVTSDLIEGD